MIKHISFDLWLTLIRSHPLFKRKRAEIMVEMCGCGDGDILKIEQLIKEQDKIFDRYNEMCGTKIPAKAMYLRLLQKVSIKSHEPTMNDAETLMNRSNEMLMNFMPVLLNNDIPHMLSSLRSDGITLSLSSNTGFVEGKILRNVLTELDIIQYFSFLIFSDEVKTSKPSMQFFQEVYNRLQLPKACILHVGDNLKTDYEGAVDFGFKALLIKNTNYLLDDIKAEL
ncbi:MAG: HAD family hydrolase [Tannerellaceae bacterium]|jgi:putative hydrolase of the HAD superfamily|nr:HAD family hydrolase [Tannerellaceae bacterium]